MSDRKKTQERFLADVRDHAIQIIRDDGVYRHVRFKRPNSNCMGFELITWPGMLCYTGDMGTYVFSRLNDMFNFFRMPQDQLFDIDFRYWAEKVEGQDKWDGLREWDEDSFKKEIRRQKGRLALAWHKKLKEDQFEDLMRELDDVVNSSDEIEAVQRVRDFHFTYWDDQGEMRSIYLDTDDFPSCKKYSYRFTWCCHALAWGIAQYDAQRPA